MTRERSPDADERGGSGKYWLAVAAITIGQVALRGWAAAGGWFYWDDFWWHDIVARNSLSETAPLSLGGHFSPLTYVPYWLLTDLFPFDWTSRVAVMIAVLLLIDVVVLALVGRLWPSRGPQLSVYALWAASALAAPSWLWYSQFSMLGALLLTSTLCMWAYLRALQKGDRASKSIALGLLVLALFTQERMLVTAVLIGAWLVFVVAAHPRAVIRAHRGLWLASGGILVIYLLIYRAVVVDAPGSALPTAGRTVVLGWEMLKTSAIPALVGGPVVLDETPVLGRAGDSPAIQGAALLAVVVAGFLSQRLNGRAWRAWSVLGLGILLDVALVAMARGSTLGEAAESEWRYFSDLAVLGPVLMVSAFVPAGNRPAFGRVLSPILTVAVVLVAVGGMLTTISLGLRWQDSMSRPFFDRALASLKANQGRSVMDRTVPDTVVNPVLGVQRLASRVFSLTEVGAAFDKPTSEPLWIDDSGSVVSGDVVPTRRSTLSGACPYPLRGTASVAIPLEGDWDWDWGVRIDYRVNVRTALVVRAGPETTQVEVEAGSGRIYVPVQQPFPGVTVYGAEPSLDGCITSVVAGPGGKAVSDPPQ